MSNFVIYYDSIQEGLWFQDLHPALKNAELKPFPSVNNGSSLITKALSYDRPDIILADKDQPIMVLERTIEVPSGHNVGQRFARLVAASQMNIPTVYFGPYAAYKHGGTTRGPRYMNLRLFYALKKVAEIENTMVTIINWPVDSNYEIIRTPDKDNKIIEYLQLFFNYYQKNGLHSIDDYLKNSEFEARQEEERKKFIKNKVARPLEYDEPPASVVSDINENLTLLDNYDVSNLQCKESVIYKVGMTYVRSDPYTGMAMLYSYLYCGGLANRIRNLILHFPHISTEQWQNAASSGTRKDVRLYRLTADGIIFSDRFLLKEKL